MTDIAPRQLRLLLDTALVEKWQQFLPLGFICGVTTNPLLLERANLPCNLEVLEKLTATAVDLGAREIHLQTWGKTQEEMIDRGRKLACLGAGHLRVLVKVPATFDGMQAAQSLLAEGCEITLTAVFNQGQVMAAAALGAAYAAPYLGRMLDDGREGMVEIRSMQKILRGTGSPTRLLVASLRDPRQITELACQGLDTFTMAPQIMADLLEDPLTHQAFADFNRAAAKG